MLFIEEQEELIAEKGESAQINYIPNRRFAFSSEQNEGSFTSSVSSGNEQWVWLAIDVVTREIVGCYIGNRSGESAKALWRSLPAGYRQCALFYIERFNCTLRQRFSQLVRKTISFSKKLENHISAIWYFIHHYNASLPLHSSFPF